ncbi:sensor histidine kinase [Massilia solisilvae]|uniref:histidine kinase n=1 Tax=Massilia solisilvae TaxID=1811225 RepID=A0ABT2BR02_9BURK|nr:sensor histidine kinase [Massilia solisilvae]MCS0610293.1 sensor histidine kinase [Massilia solisilvae]
MNRTIAHLNAATVPTERLACARRPILLTVAGWILCAAVFATQSHFAAAVRGQSVPWGAAFAAWLVWASGWALLTLPILRLAKRVPFERRAFWRVVAVHVPGSVVAVLFNLALYAAAAPLVGAPGVGPDWSANFSRLFVMTFLPNLAVYWALVGAVQFLRLRHNIHERERRHLRLEAQLAEAQLLALKSQLQPHFLFNTLNSIAVLIGDDPAAARYMLQLLCGLLRKVLDNDGSREVTLREELDFIASYLAIEQIRFADRLSYHVDAGPDVMQARVPSLVLQPLVENAIRHGVARRARPGRIVISARADNGMLRLAVTDNGAGLGRDVKWGIGLSNTRARLQQMFGARHAFDIGENPGGGTAVSLAIPLQEGPCASVH